MTAPLPPYIYIYTSSEEKERKKKGNINTLKFVVSTEVH